MKFGKVYADAAIGSVLAILNACSGVAEQFYGIHEIPHQLSYVMAAALLVNAGYDYRKSKRVMENVEGNGRDLENYSRDSLEEEIGEARLQEAIKSLEEIARN